MKRRILLGIIFIFITILTFYSLYYEETSNQYNNLINIGQTKNSHKIVISSGNKSQQEIYGILKNYLEKYKGNLFCFDSSNKNGKSIYTKYIYSTNIDLFKSLPLTKGRFFDQSEKESDVFLSTVDTGNDKQIGQIADLAGDNHFEVRTLKSSSNINIFNRNFFIILENDSDLDPFISQINKEGLYIQRTPEINNVAMNNTLFLFGLAACFLSLILIVFYDLLNSYKRIAIEKMLGFSKLAIWFRRLTEIIFVQIASMLITTFALILVNFKVFNQLFFPFLLKLFSIYGWMVLISIVFISIPFLYIPRINISNMLKNKRPVQGIIIINTCIKIGLLCGLIVITLNVYTQYQMISSRYVSSYENWENTKEYATVPTIGTTVSMGDIYTEENKQRQKKMFFYFNDRGAIYADFQYYLPNNRELNVKNVKINYKIDFITINPNYLASHPIYDENGKQVNIAETESEFTLLIPEKYHSLEKEIREYYQFIKKGYNSTEEATGDQHQSVKTPSIVVNQGIKIIWTKTNQKYFSYQLDINPQEANCITDPIARVLTESNGDDGDYYVVMGYMGSPFKIKVSDPSNPSASIMPKIKELYDTSIYSFPIYSVYDSVGDQILTLRRQILFMVSIVVVMAIIIAVIIFQNVINYFEQYRLRLAIMQFHGYKKFDKYKRYFLMVGVSWLIIWMVLVFIIKPSEPPYGLIVPAVLFEFIISLLVLVFVEKRKVLKVTKGG